MQIIRFGTNGWHERFEDGFDEKSVSAIASALGYAWGEDAAGKTVMVTYDARHHSEEFALRASGILSTYGLRVKLSASPAPTPALGWAVACDDECVGGVAICAGDLPHEYGGILVRGADGGPVSEAFAERVDSLISPVTSAEGGALERIDLVTPYLTSVLSAIDVEKIRLRRPRVVVDSMHGSCSGSAASLLRAAGCSVIDLHGDAREDFGGLHPEAAEPWVDECERTVTKLGADFGIVFDGDGERCAFVDERGRLVPPHTMLALLLRHLVLRRGETGRVVTTHASSARITREADRLGVELSSVPVGFRRLYVEAKVGDVLLACDEYGGACFPAHFPERDALLCALHVVEALCDEAGSAGQIFDEVEEETGRMYYAHKDVRLDAASLQAFSNLLPGLNPRSMAGRVPVAVSHADGMKVFFEGDAWAMVRPSRTESLVRVYAESSTPGDRDSLLAEACDLARGDVGGSMEG